MGEWVPYVGEWVETPNGQGQVIHLDADTETAMVRVDSVPRTFALSALRPGKPSSAWGG